jgi:shikimate 5-dehydrogenase
MLIAQGAAQFRWWTGRTPSLALMRAAATERLAVLAREAA